MLAFKQGQFHNSAKLFTSAMQMDGFENFISEITGQPPVSALTDGSVPQAENTIAPSIASESSDFQSLSSIVEELAAEFSMSNTLIDDGDFEEESRSSDESEEEESTSSYREDPSEEDDDAEEPEEEDGEEEDSIEATAYTETIGPVRFK